MFSRYRWYIVSFLVFFSKSGKGQANCAPRLIPFLVGVPSNKIDSAVLLRLYNACDSALYAYGESHSGFLYQPLRGNNQINIQVTTLPNYSSTSEANKRYNDLDINKQVKLADTCRFFAMIEVNFEDSIIELYLFKYSIGTEARIWKFSYKNAINYEIVLDALNAHHRKIEKFFLFTQSPIIIPEKAVEIDNLLASIERYVEDEEEAGANFPELPNQPSLYQKLHKIIQSEKKGLLYEKYLKYKWNFFIKKYESAKFDNDKRTWSLKIVTLFKDHKFLFFSDLLSFYNQHKDKKYIAEYFKEYFKEFEAKNPSNRTKEKF